MLATRSALNWLGITLGLLEAQVPQNRFHPAFFNISELPIPDGFLKASHVPRKAADLDTSVVHITAVSGGFGVSRKSLAIWDAAVSAGILQKRFPLLYEQLRASQALDDHDLLVRRLATWERYRKTPYHQIGSQSGDVLANRSLDQRSYHAGPGNYGAGCAFDCGLADKLTDDFVATCQAALRTLHFRMRSVGDPSRQILVEPHRAYSSQRRKDPGPAAWAAIVIPVVEADPRLVVDYELCMADGLPVPRSWDNRALFDDKGKRIR